MDQIANGFQQVGFTNAIFANDTRQTVGEIEVKFGITPKIAKRNGAKTLAFLLLGRNRDVNQRATKKR